MISMQTIRGKWKEVSGKIKEKWGDLTDDDLKRGEGNVEKLIGIVQRKTGEARESIEEFFTSMGEELSSGNLMDRAQQFASGAGEAIQTAASNAGQFVQHAAENVQDTVGQGYKQATKLVKKHPLESVMVSVGAGILGGVLISLLLYRRNS